MWTPRGRHASMPQRVQRFRPASRDPAGIPALHRILRERDGPAVPRAPPLRTAVWAGNLGPIKQPPSPCFTGRLPPDGRGAEYRKQPGGRDQNRQADRAGDEDAQIAAGEQQRPAEIRQVGSPREFPRAIAKEGATTWYSDPKVRLLRSIRECRR